MFEMVSVFGVRAAVWTPGPGRRLPVRLLTPGPGTTARARATTACDVAETDHPAPSLRRRRKAATATSGATAQRAAHGRSTAARVLAAAAAFTPDVNTDEAAAMVSAASGSAAVAGRVSTLSTASGAAAVAGTVSAADARTRARLCAGTPGDAWVAAALELSGWLYSLQQAEVGPDLAAALADRPDALAPGPGRGNLLADDETRWADAILISVRERERLIAHLQAAQYADIGEVSAHYPGCHDFLPAEIALMLSCSESSAQRLLGAAEAFRDKIPATLAALSDGTIDETRAAAILTTTTPCDPDVARRVEAAVLPAAATVTAATVRRRCERAIIAIDPGGAQGRHERRARERYLSRWAETDGMAGLRLYSTAQDVTTIWHALTTLADQAKTPGDDRDLGNRRVDALTDLCITALTGDWTCPPTAADDTVEQKDRQLRRAVAGQGGRAGSRSRRIRPLVRVTMPITALLGSDEPCDLDGWGPITARQARMIAADATLTRLVCDPLSGTLLDYGLTRYEPPATLQQFVRTRDRTCAMPGCSQPADRCDIDHVIPARPNPGTGLPTQGATAAANLAPVCRHHHLSKDASGGWRLQRRPDGTYVWTTPLGHSFQRSPQRFWRPPPEALVVRSNGDLVARNVVHPTDGPPGAAAPDDRSRTAYPDTTGPPPY